MESLPSSTRGVRLARRLATGLPALLFTGCMAWGLAGRGVDHEADILTHTLEMAPVDIPAAGGHHDGPQPAPLETAAPFDGWVHGYWWEIVGPDGTRLDEDLLHHLKLSAPERRELFNTQMLRIAGAGRETRPVDLPPQVGYRVRRGDPLLLTAMTHNETGADVHGARVRLHLRYTPEGPWRPPLSAFPFFAQVTPPGQASSFDLPQGRSEHVIVLTPAISGRVLGFGGHAHAHAVELRFEDAISGELLWSTTPVQDADGAILEVPSELFVMRGGIPLKSGSAYRFVAVYDNPTGAAIPDGGMATVGGLFAPSEPWPAADMADPIYVWDVDRETAGSSHDAGHDGSGHP